MIKIYKNIILLMAMTYSLFFFMPYLWPQIYSVEVQTFLNLSGLNSKIDMTGPLAYIISFVYIFSYIGLFYFHPIGRIVFTALVIFNLTLGSYILGYSATAYLDTSFGYLLTLLEGGVLMIIYFTEISTEFKSKKVDT